MTLRKLFLTAIACVFGLASSASAQATPFIVFGPNVKVVFTTVTIGGNKVKQARASITETAANGTITSRVQTQVIVPDGNGGFEQIVTQEQAVAILTSLPGDPPVYTVIVTRNEATTELDSSQTPTGTPPVVVADPVGFTPGVAQGDLDLPEETTLLPVDEDLNGEVIVVSPL